MRLWLLILVSVFFARVGQGAEPPVTPGALPQARALLAWLAGQKQIVSGQAEPAPGGGALAASPEREFERIFKVTGKTPAIRAFDLCAVTPVSSNKPPLLAEVNRAIAWGRSNGIVTIQWHWLAPNRSGDYDYAVKGAEERKNGWRGFDLDRALVSGTPEHDELLAGIDAAAAELARLRDAGVPVLWRPLYEASGGWFWWGSRGPEPFKRLWQLMYQRMTFRHHLNNLLWVYTPAEANDLEEWYPGDEYVDILGLDRYADTGEHPSFKEDYEALRLFSQGRKVLALTETGSIPDPSQLVKDQAKWAYFCTWCGNFVLDNKVNPSDYLAQVYQNSYVATRGTLPVLRDLPAPSTGPAQKIVFVRQPVAMAVEGRMASPVTVVAEDAAGQVVRNVSGTVILKTEGIHASQMEVPFFNGVASFIPEGFTNKAGGVRFVAEAKNLGNATSRSFEIGPGSGISWELWSSVSDLPEQLMQTAPKATGRARDRFEIAFEQGTLLRAKGVVIPPVSGKYVFWIAAGDRAWLSVQGQRIASVTKPANVREWSFAPTQHSVPIELQAGVRYAIEAGVECATVGGHLEVGWTLPDGNDERPMQGRHLE